MSLLFNLSVMILSSSLLSMHQFIYVVAQPKNEWNQIGLNFYGEASGGECASSIAMSADGGTIAIDAIRKNRTGHVRVYPKYSFDQAYKQVGADIDAKASFEGLGFSLAMSTNGLTGSDIIGEAPNDFFPISLAMSNDSQTIAGGKLPIVAPTTSKVPVVTQTKAKVSIVAPTTAKVPVMATPTAKVPIVAPTIAKVPVVRPTTAKLPVMAPTTAKAPAVKPTIGTVPVVIPIMAPTTAKAPAVTPSTAMAPVVKPTIAPVAASTTAPATSPTGLACVIFDRSLFCPVVFLVQWIRRLFGFSE